MAEIFINDKRGPSTLTNHTFEADTSRMHPLVSWRSVVAGLLVSFLTLAILLSLGMAFGGIGLDDGASAQNAGIFTGVWFLVSSVVSLFVGSYFAARVSNFHTNRIGSAQGLVIASLFFGFILYQTFSAIGWMGRTASSAVSTTASAVTSAASQAAGNSTVNMIVEDAIGDLNLRSDPQTVATGVVSRLAQGNTEGAKNYLARQAGISPAEADRRIGGFRDQASQAMIQAREGAAKALQASGWSLFATMLFGGAAALSGGALGSLANLRKPLTREQAEAAADLKPAHA